MSTYCGHSRPRPCTPRLGGLRSFPDADCVGHAWAATTGCWGRHRRASGLAPRSTAFTRVRDGPALSPGRWPGCCLGICADQARIHIQRLRRPCLLWTVRQPTRQIHLLKPIRLEDLHVHKIRVPNILDIVTKRLLDVADVAGMEVCGHSLRPGVEDGYASFSLHPVVPFVGVGMPMHGSQTARLDRHHGCSHVFRDVQAKLVLSAKAAPTRSSSHGSS